MRGCGIENVVFNWDVFIVELINEPQGCNGLSVGSKTSFAEFLSDGLELVRQRYIRKMEITYVENLDILNLCSFQLRVKVTRENRVNLLVGKLTAALDDTLPDPCILIGDNTSMRVDFENNTDSQAFLTWGQGANFRCDLWWQHVA